MLSSMLTDGQIALAASGDADTLTALDQRGLLLGDGESPAAYADRLRVLRANLERMEAALAGDGTFAVEGIQVAAADRIPTALF